MNKAKIKAKQILTKHIEVVREYPHGNRMTHDVFIEDKEHATITAELLSKDFVVKNGGKISVESKAGKGSTFKFTLPHKPA